MARPVQAIAEVRFAADAAGEDINLQIEPDTIGGAGDFNVHLLLFPAINAEVRTDVGSVRKGTTKTVGVPPGVLQINGGTSARLPKVPYENPTIQVIRASDASGAPTRISIALNPATGEVRSNVECYAAISYSAYRARGLELTYSPQMSGGLTTFGTIVAFYPPRSQTAYQVGAFDIENGNVEVELYRIISHAVTTPDGEFEEPNADGSYSGAALKLDMSTSLRTERVHEIGYMDQRGRAWVRSVHVPIKEPFIGNTAYTPTKECRVSPVPPDLFTREQIAKASNFVKSRGYGCKGS